MERLITVEDNVIARVHLYTPRASSETRDNVTFHSISLGRDSSQRKYCTTWDILYTKLRAHFHWGLQGSKFVPHASSSTKVENIPSPSGSYMGACFQNCTSCQDFRVFSPLLFALGQLECLEFQLSMETTKVNQSMICKKSITNT